MSKIRLALVTLSVSLGGCYAAYADYAPTRDIIPARAPVPADAVAVYFGDPPCAYTEIGLMEAHDGSFSSSLDAKLWAMRKRAGHNGANGIIILDHQDTGDHHGTDHHYSALAVVIDACVTASPCATAPAGPTCTPR